MTAVTAAPRTAAGAEDARIALAGSGRLFTATRRVLGAAGAVVSPDGPLAAGIDLLVTLADGWRTADPDIVRRVCEAAGTTWLPVRIELGRVVIGPAEPPGEPGCVTCAEVRQTRLRDDPAGFAAVWQRYGTVLADRPSSWLTPLACAAVAAVVADQARQLTEVVPTPGPSTRNGVLTVDLGDLSTTRHAFLAEPMCPHCGRLPDDSAEDAAIVLASRPKPDPRTYRVRAATRERDRLVRTYADPDWGVVKPPEIGYRGGLATARARLGLRSGRTDTSGFGRTRSYRDSESVAILEALERYGGISPGGRRTVVREPFAHLADRALDPRRLGLYPAERYRSPDFPYRPFDPNRVEPWVWGHSFRSGTSVLVPEAIAYYGMGPGLAYECSSGCALGGSVEEAIMYALLEVVERDAFLITWHARLPAPRVDLRSAPDRTVALLATTIEQEMDCRVTAYDITMEFGIPTIWVMAVTAESGPDAAKAACAAAAHPDPSQAAMRALGELGPMVANIRALWADQAERSRRLAEAPAEATEMNDHVLIYANPQVFDRFAFLVDPPGLRTFGDAFAPDRPPIQHADLRDDLHRLLDRVLSTGLDVAVVDQTTPEHRQGDLSCVKVIIPGALPMTFGHRYRRLDGLPRLLDVPRQLGYRDRPLAPSEVSHHPHPFP
jgi:ribosomal protein S12 methylthiotransferase accessory factor